MRRLPPPSRPDFAEYKRQFRLPPLLFVSNFGLLGRTEAKLPSDGFSLVDPLDGAVDHCDLMLEVAGYGRYPQILAPLSVGDPVWLQAEPWNEVDQNAVVIRASGQTIGYVNRLQAAAFQQWLRERAITSVVERLNGQPAPRAFVFIRIRPARARANASAAPSPAARWMPATDRRLLTPNMG